MWWLGINSRSGGYQFLGLLAYGSCLCSNEQDSYGYDETSYDDCYGLSFETHLNDCSTFTVHANRLEIVE